MDSVDEIALQWSPISWGCQLGKTEEDRDRARRLQLADRFWKEFQYRHRVYWQLLQRSVVFVTALNAIPFLAKRYSVSAPYLFVAPALASILTIGTALILRAEGARVAKAALAVRELLRPLMPDEVRDKYFIVKEGQQLTKIQKIIGAPAVISQNMPALWAFFGIIISLGATFVAYSLP